MENYTKGETKEVEEPPVFSHDETGVAMKVNAGSRIRNLIGFALKKMKEPEIRRISWSGSGNAITKTVSCVEILKRKIKNLHQITKIRYRRIEEYWEPQKEGLERLKVNKDIPAISILLSKDPLDKTEPGYQSPGLFDTFWVGLVQNDKPLPPRPHPQGGNSGRGRGGRRGKDRHDRRDNPERSKQSGSQDTFSNRNNKTKNRKEVTQSKSDGSFSSEMKR